MALLRSSLIPTNEQTITMDPWLRDVIEGRHGFISPNILFNVAGQNELDRNLWAPYEALIARIQLDLFTEEEAQEYLGSRGIGDSHLIGNIIDLSGRLPLLLATLATAPVESTTTDPTDTAVKRFLKWVEEPHKRQGALHASVPRFINRDVMSLIVTPQRADEIFEWLCHYAVYYASRRSMGVPCRSS
jgi:hypothetical protein